MEVRKGVPRQKNYEQMNTERTEYWAASTQLLIIIFTQYQSKLHKDSIHEEVLKN